MKWRVLISVAVIILLLAGGLLYVKGTPRYSIFLLTCALKNHDADTALKFIDVDSLAESLVKNLVIDGGGKRKAGKDLVAAISMNMPSIKEGIRTYLVEVIRSPGGTKEMKQQVIPGFPDFDMHDIGALSILRLHIETHGNTASVRLKKKPGQSAEMTKTDEGYWKFVGISAETTGKE